MPIGQPFNQQYQVGDVIYGISHARTAYTLSLNDDLKRAVMDHGEYLLCDHYNNRTFGNYNGLGTSPDSKAHVKGNLQTNKTTPHLNANQKTSVGSYYKALDKSKYSPLEALKMKLTEVQAKGNAGMDDIVFRRACKFGLVYFIEELQRNVHFVLDVPPAYGVPGNRINSLDIALKNRHAGHVPITTSELRCCYRNRAKWIPTGRLKFYFNLIEVNPPWVDHPAEWAVYQAHRVMKGKA